MVLPWALAVLSLLPLLDAQDIACANLKAAPITNDTLERISGKWFYIASALRNPQYKESSREIQATFFHVTPNMTEDVILIKEYQTIRGQCIYNSSYLKVHRENGTLSRYEWGIEHFAHLLLTKDPKTYMFSFFPEDELNRGLVFYANKPEVSEEQLREFYDALKCMDLQETEILYSDGKKDLCGPLEKQHEEAIKKRKKGSSVDPVLA
ncbi:PREDICTED: alpha-1-acid glycoprotein 2 [Chrysochloris asiatica]|uniref:Alpha-1-acid glycoprotein 2 n=1 Tax=Chrysochloris asiatica TaxID=185453 RepID=A0A9B0TSC7_CHRAS|nr:PREDICTED: alpha-1-acid glycoprotein 2 [Chrysochloris asiatica]